MTDEQKHVGALIIVNLDRAHQSLAHIEAILEPLGISVAVVESGRRLHWTTAVAIRIPENRLADAMLALELKGFADVMAYHSEPQGVTERRYGVGEK